VQARREEDMTETIQEAYVRKNLRSAELYPRFKTIYPPGVSHTICTWLIRGLRAAGRTMSLMQGGCDLAPPTSMGHERGWEPELRQGASLAPRLEPGEY
jgi:hypothetical protein